MKIISTKYILTCSEKFEILEDQAICFDKKIIDIDSLEVLKGRYPQAEIIENRENSVLMPGLINAHVHLEFSANRDTLKYGDFISWLKSVIEYRDDLNSECNGGVCIKKALDKIKKSGTTTIGAISSFGVDLEACVNSPLNVVYFNEVLGSNPATVDALYSDFYERLNLSKKYKNKNFIPAISVHSPYSTHPILAKKALSIAKDENMVVSTHFMESKAERDWLDKADGDFVEFFAPFAPYAKPVNEPISYIELFLELQTLFTHVNKATDEELDIMQKIGTITHCPISNRLLGNGKLDISKIDNFTLATDGLSSNNSLSMWDEMRGALMMHHDEELHQLAQKLIKSSTLNGALALNLNKGVIQNDKDSDFIVIELSKSIKNLNDLPLSLILHTKNIKESWIDGELI